MITGYVAFWFCVTIILCYLNVVCSCEQHFAIERTLPFFLALIFRVATYVGCALFWKSKRVTIVFWVECCICGKHITFERTLAFFVPPIFNSVAQQVQTMNTCSYMYMVQ